MFASAQLSISLSKSQISLLLSLFYASLQVVSPSFSVIFVYKYSTAISYLFNCMHFSTHPRWLFFLLRDQQAALIIRDTEPRNNHNSNMGAT